MHVSPSTICKPLMLLVHTCIVVGQGIIYPSHVQLCTSISIGLGVLLARVILLTTFVSTFAIPQYINLLILLILGILLIFYIAVVQPYRSTSILTPNIFPCKPDYIFYRDL